MMKNRKKIFFTDQSKLDFNNIRAYTASNFGDRQAEKYVKDIIRSVRKLRVFPKAGIERNELESGCRSTTAGKHVILYRFRNEKIEILRVVHSSRELKKTLKIERKRKVSRTI